MILFIDMDMEPEDDDSNWEPPAKEPDPPSEPPPTKEDDKPKEKKDE